MERRKFLKTVGTALAGAALWPVGESSAKLYCRDFPERGLRQCEAGISSDVLQVTAAAVGGQRMDQWCWAAAIEMVFRYYGYVVRQDRIVQATWGDYYNRPANSDVILMNLNREWVDDRGRQFAAMGNMTTANVYTAVQDLSNDMPLIIGTMGHAMVLTSMVYYCGGWNGHDWSECGVVSAVVRDPWPGRNRRKLTQEEWNNIHFLTRIRVQGY